VFYAWAALPLKSLLCCQVTPTIGITRPKPIFHPMELRTLRDKYPSPLGTFIFPESRTFWKIFFTHTLVYWRLLEQWHKEMQQLICSLSRRMRQNSVDIAIVSANVN
jgi:hypothetical protein